MKSGNTSVPVLSKNAKRRLKKKAEKQLAYINGLKNGNTTSRINKSSVTEKKNDSTMPEVTVEYVSSDLDLPEHDPSFEEFSRIFQKFMKPEELCGDAVPVASEATQGSSHEKVPIVEEEMMALEEPQQQLGRKARKKLKQLSIATLKQLVACPDVVEAHDVTSADPRFLCYLKAYRNTVPVPRHWCHKRKYLQGKRGIEKMPFILPEFIANTGIGDVRGALLEDELKKKNSAKMRERMQPKLGRIDIDYQVLHDAFFKHQTKPLMSTLGDLYYEGKEFEVKLKTKVPGMLSDELKRALGMVEGVPPPWLLNMQRYGPPPSYPHLKIPGLSAPIPDGASFGYHPGGWGKPPVDEHGQPLYGDVFGKAAMGGSSGTALLQTEVEVNRARWGELAPVKEEEDEEDEDEHEGDEDDTNAEQSMTAQHHHLAVDACHPDAMSDSGISSVLSGVSTPGGGTGVIDLRKGTKGLDTPESTPKALYTVLAQKEMSVAGTSALYGSAHAYVVHDTIKHHASTSSDSGGGDVSISSSMSVMSGMETDESSLDEESRKRKRKEKEKAKKNYKEFKF